MTVDPNIQQKADYIRTKKKGSEVRESLASGLEAMSSDVVENKNRQNEVETQFQQVIENTTDKDVISAPEIIAARNGEPDLKSRLDKDHQEVTAQLAQTSKGNKPPHSVWSEFEERFINIKWYEPLAEDNDWTLALEKAIEDADGRKIIFPNDGTKYHLREIPLSSNIDIDGMNSKIIMEEEIIFNIQNDLDYIKITGLDLEINNKTSVGKHNLIYCHRFDVKNVNVFKNSLDYAGLHIFSTIFPGNLRPRITENVWEQETDIPITIAMIRINVGSMNENLKFGGWILDNYINLFYEDSDNVDVIRVSEGGTGVLIENNILINRNAQSKAEIDLFSGSHKARIVNNHFFNVSIKRQQQRNPANNKVNHVASYDTIVNNSFDKSLDSIQDYFIMIKGSLFTISGNTMKGSSNNSTFRAIYLNRSNIQYDEFETEAPVLGIIDGNMVDLRNETQPTNYFINLSSNLDKGNFIVTNNNVVGGSHFISNAIVDSILSNNMWTKHWSSRHGGIVVGGNSIASSNYVDGDIQIPAIKNDRLPLNPIIIDESADDITIDSSKGRIFSVRGGGSVSTIENGRSGDQIILSTNTNRTFTVKNGTIRLSNNEDFTMTPFSTLTLMHLFGNAWVELSRSKRI